MPRRRVARTAPPGAAGDLRRLPVVDLLDGRQRLIEVDGGGEYLAALRLEPDVVIAARRREFPVGIRRIAAFQIHADQIAHGRRIEEDGLAVLTEGAPGGGEFLDPIAQRRRGELATLLGLA